MDPEYARRVGERLRAIRAQKAMSLSEVEQASSKEFKASVLGAYERGERALSVPRLQRLAQFYGVPADRLLPPSQDRVVTLDAPASQSLRVDLVRLASDTSADAVVVGRYVSMIQMARGDYNGRILSVRADDVRALSAALGLSVDTLAARFDSVSFASPPVPIS